MIHQLMRTVPICFVVASLTCASASAQRPIATPPIIQAGVQDALKDSVEVGADSYLENDSYGNNACAPSCCLDSLFGRGLIKRSDHSFNSFISPMSNPVFFEDPRSVTEARAIFLQHRVPTAAGGGDVQLYAVQLRARLSEYVSLIATKDGYVTSSNPLVDDGWADLSAGLKFNLIRDVQNQRLLSGGFTFEMPTGEASALQGNGDGELNIFLTGGRQIGRCAHWISATGLRVPMNSTDESLSAYWSNHLDYQIRRGIYLLAELNWFHWLQAGVDGPLPGVEGLDLFNFGSPGVAGNDIVTSAFGFKLKPNRHNEIGVAFEVPLTVREDIIDNRLTVDWIFRF